MHVQYVYVYLSITIWLCIGVSMHKAHENQGLNNKTACDIPNS